MNNLVNILGTTSLVLTGCTRSTELYNASPSSLAIQDETSEKAGVRDYYHVSSWNSDFIEESPYSVDERSFIETVGETVYRIDGRDLIVRREMQHELDEGEVAHTMRIGIIGWVEKPQYKRDITKHGDVRYISSVEPVAEKDRGKIELFLMNEGYSGDFVYFEPRGKKNSD